MVDFRIRDMFYPKMPDNEFVAMVKNSKLSIDHIVPRSFIKKLKINNKQLIPDFLNGKKSNKLTNEALKKILSVIIEHL